MQIERSNKFRFWVQWPDGTFKKWNCNTWADVEKHRALVLQQNGFSRYGVFMLPVRRG